jgi:hypothetical protein
MILVKRMRVVAKAKEASWAHVGDDGKKCGCICTPTRWVSMCKPHQEEWDIRHKLWNDRKKADDASKPKVA